MEEKYLSEKYAHYSIVIQEREYMFAITRDGEGVCVCQSDAVNAMHHEDKNMAAKALFFGDEKARRRLQNIEGEFSVDFKFPERIVILIWEDWDRACRGDFKSTPESKMREIELDAALIPVVNQLFGT